MKNRKDRIVILILVGLVLFSSSLALLMYSKQSNSNKFNMPSEEQVKIYAATKYLHKGDMIGAADITTINLPKSYLAFAPLTQSEIIGRYATVDIFQKEPFRKEKISIVKPLAEKAIEKKLSEAVEVEEEEVVQKGSDTISVSLSVFKNIDNTLKKGDYIDIVSITGKKLNNKETEFTTKYIALRVPIHSFVHNYSNMKTFIGKDDKNKLIVADSVVLKMSPDDIKNFLSVYYKAQELNSNRVYNASKGNIGHLWMVKCSKEADEDMQKKKNRLLADYVAHMRRKTIVQNISISYEQ